ncbi:MAG: NAD-dependent epimerase/dehydratase family protein [Candidatus Thorarchaeota archaeon]
MRVFLLGGTGLLGSHLLPLLLERGHNVTVLTRSRSKLEYLESCGASAIVGDLLKPNEFMSSLIPHEIVVNIAMPFAFGRMSKSTFNKMRENTTRFVANALAIGEEFKCPTILTLGTSYKTGPGEVADETWPIERFGITLAGADADAIINRAIENGQPIIQMIPGQIYGPGGNFMMMYEMMMSGRFGIFGKGDNYIPRIHVEDCANAYLLAIEKNPVGEKYIIADDTPCTTREFSEYMAFCGGKPAPRTLPNFVARLVLGNLLLETLNMNCIVSNAKAKFELGWDLKYPSYREGLEDVISRLQDSSLDGEKRTGSKYNS